MILVFLFLLASVSLSSMEITSEHDKTRLLEVIVGANMLTGYLGCPNYFLVNANETVCCKQKPNSLHPEITITNMESACGYKKSLYIDENGNVRISATETVERLYKKRCSPNENDEKNKEQDYVKYLKFFLAIQTKRKEMLQLPQNHAEAIA